MTQSLTYREIERQIVEILPELRPAAEYYWLVQGEPHSDPGPYVLFEDMFGAYVTILLAMPLALLGETNCCGAPSGSQTQCC